MSPKLFISALAYAFKTIIWIDKGISVNGEKLHHLSYADNIVPITDDLAEISDMLEELNFACPKLN